MTITPEQFLAEVRTVAEKKMADNGGIDYVYPRHERSDMCLYVHETEMGLQADCLVGTWLHQERDVPLQAMFARPSCASVLLGDLGLGTMNDGKYAWEGRRTLVQLLADQVQKLQDGGTPWLAAVELVEQGYQRRIS